MGDQRAYEKGRNDFYSYLYTTMSPRVTINVTGKIIEKKTIHNERHNTLPAYSCTSEVYFAKGADGLASQCKVYSNGKMLKDFDWDHSHRNSDGTFFPEGTVHVQEYTVSQRKGKDGKYHDYFRRSSRARPMTQAEIVEYGPIIKHFNPNVRF